MASDARYRRRPSRKQRRFAAKSEIFSPELVPGNKHPRRGRKRNFTTIAATPPISDIFGHRSQELIPMEATKFEPFGEEVNLAESAEAPSRASGWLMRLGAGLFWALAGTIVVARAIYFDPGIFDGFARAVAF